MKITIIGFGHMGRAFAESFAHNLHDCTVFVSDHTLKQNSKLSFKNMKIDLNLDNISKSDFVILAVKPQDLFNLSLQIKDKLNKNSILVSIAAGVNLAKLEKFFQHKKIIRCMPNLAIKNGQGIVGWIAQSLDKKEKTKVKNFLTSTVVNFEVEKEDLIDAVTAISGSGPAYFFLLCSSMLKTAIDLGFTEEQANLLVTQTLVGAGAIKQNQSGVSFDELIDKIASKKGTTEAAIKYFSKKGFNLIVKNAVKQSYIRAKEISRE